MSPDLTFHVVPLSMNFMGLMGASCAITTPETILIKFVYGLHSHARVMFPFLRDLVLTQNSPQKIFSLNRKSNFIEGQLDPSDINCRQREIQSREEAWTLCC